MIVVDWDAKKAVPDIRDRRVSFEQAAVAFPDPLAVEWIDTTEDHNEERSVLLGLYEREVPFIVYTERGPNIGIISAGRAERQERDGYCRQNAP